MVSLGSLAARCAGTVALAAASAASATCDRWNPLSSSSGLSGPIGPKDLIELVGIGRADAEPIGGPSPIAVSPDRRWATFVLQRAVVETNRYCQALILIDLTYASPSRVLDRGGEYIVAEVTMRGTSIPNGFPQQIVPQWSADGKMIGYLRRDGETTQLWIAPADRGSPRPVTTEESDIVQWRWMPDGRVEFEVAKNRRRLTEQIDAEARIGWVYDARVTPNSSFRPQLPAPLELQTKLLDLTDENLTVQNVEDRTEDRQVGPAIDLNEHQPKIDAELVPLSPSPLSPKRLVVRGPGEASIPCNWDACTGRFDGLWRSGPVLVFLKREGWNGRYSTLYRWSPGGKAPRPLVRTDDWLERCVIAGAELLCIRETAKRPSHIVAIDLASGSRRTVFDPNPGIENRIGGSVQRMSWRNALGLEVFGDLVLPSGHRPGKRLPTIVTLYHSRGFLRGGTGNEYPVHLFAQRGYAVLSIQRPELFAARFPSLETVDAVYAANVRDWSERRNMHSAIESGIDLLVAQNIADPQKLGLTGLSDGATSVRFALINSDRFAAASLSSCCVDETTAVLAGPVWATYSRSAGYPLGFPVDEMFWKPGSLVLNASSISTPLLMQLADYEALYALPSFAALSQYDQPVELRIFPGEYHIKWQPQHRDAIYRTNIEWFDFWLKSASDPAPEKAAQYARWNRLKQARSNDAGQPRQERIQVSTSASRITRP